MDQYCTRLSFELVGPHETLVDRAARELDIGPVGASRVLLRDRGAVGHEDGRFDPQQPRCQRDALGVVAGARCDDTEPALLR